MWCVNESSVPQYVLIASYGVVVSISSDEDSSDDNSNEMEDIQKALAEAERVAREANEKAATLRKLAEDKILSGKGGSNGTKITRELLVERLV